MDTSDATTPASNEQETPASLPIRLVKFPGGVPDLNEGLRHLPPGEIIRIRMPLTLFVARQRYPVLPQNYWVLEFRDAAELTKFRAFLTEAIGEYVAERQGEAQGQ